MGKDEDMEKFYLSCHFSVFTCVRAAVNSAVLRSSEITFGLLIIFFILPYFFLVISNFNMPSFLQENEKSSERSELRFTVPTSWELQLWSITILAPKCILNAPQSSKIEQFLPLNNFKNHHVFQSSPISSDNTYLQFQNFSKFFSFSNGVWCRGRIVWEIGNFWRQIKKNEPLPQSTTSMESEMRCCLDRLKRYVQELLSIREERGSSFVPQSKEE